MKPLRTAIIGCGSYGREHAARLAALPDTPLVAFYDHKLDKAAAYSHEFGGGAAYDDTARMFAEMDLNLVYICLPPFAHTNEVELACRYGAHFLIEKPVALTVTGAEAMAERARAAGIKTQVGFQFRHGAAVRWLAQYCAGPGAGERAFMSAHYACNALHRWWWRDRNRSGGQVFEQITHLLDLTRLFLGEPAQIFSMQDNLFHRDTPDYTVEDASATTIRFTNGSIATIAATNGAIPGRWDSDWRVVLPRLTVDFASASRATIHHTDREPVEAETIASDADTIMAQTLDLLAAIRDDRPALCPLDEGVRTLRLGAAAMESAASGLPVNL
ncbi:MAG: Gfo/Idh/MocA family oxidoreductase [Chloroflexi bacterium]|nr:Gfo/Idh/MocA family oxidoreductase [Chloroflexota bacterium]